MNEFIRRPNCLPKTQVLHVGINWFNDIQGKEQPFDFGTVYCVCGAGRSYNLLVRHHFHSINWDIIQSFSRLISANLLLSIVGPFLYQIISIPLLHITSAGLEEKKVFCETNTT